MPNPMAITPGSLAALALKASDNIRKKAAINANQEQVIAVVQLKLLWDILDVALSPNQRIIIKENLERVIRENS